MKSIHTHLRISGFILLLTGCAKLVSSISGTESIFGSPDPIFGIPVRLLLSVLALLEFVVGAVCVIESGVRTRALLLSWICSMFIFYRIGMVWTNYHRSCTCLGNITDVLHLSQAAADRTAQFLLAYMTVVAGTALFCSRRNIPGGGPGAVSLKGGFSPQNTGI